jgi:hypothetical protein
MSVFFHLFEVAEPKMTQKILRNQIALKKSLRNPNFSKLTYSNLTQQKLGPQKVKFKLQCNKI